jgi:hypothetical protein
MPDQLLQVPWVTCHIDLPSGWAGVPGVCRLGAMAQALDHQPPCSQAHKSSQAAAVTGAG